MRHRVQKKKLNRDTDHRKALLRNLSRSLILDGVVETTLAKAKFVRPYVEKLVTKAKKGPDFTNLNRVNSKLRSKQALKILFADLAVRFSDRNGGYTRIVKLGNRRGDNSAMARLEWITGPAKSEKEENKNTETKIAKPPRTKKTVVESQETDSKETD